MSGSKEMMEQKTERNVTAKIVVTTHKQYRMPDDAVYFPLFVGAAAARGRRER